MEKLLAPFAGSGRAISGPLLYSFDGSYARSLSLSQLDCEYEFSSYSYRSASRARSQFYVHSTTFGFELLVATAPVVVKF